MLVLTRYVYKCKDIRLFRSHGVKTLVLVCQVLRHTSGSLMVKPGLGQ